MGSSREGPDDDGGGDDDDELGLSLFVVVVVAVAESRTGGWVSLGAAGRGSEPGPGLDVNLGSGPGGVCGGAIGRFNLLCWLGGLGFGCRWEPLFVIFSCRGYFVGTRVIFFLRGPGAGVFFSMGFMGNGTGH